MLDLTDEIFRNTEKNKITVLICLDYSKAFDCVNHDLLLSILHYVGACQSVLTFFKSYLSKRRQTVLVNHTFSDYLTVNSGVPQGSVLGPLLYSLYTAFLLKELKFCKFHMYADDIQLFGSFRVSEVDSSIAHINSDLQGVALASLHHSLVINPRKTAFMVFGRRRSLALVEGRIQLSLEGIRLPIVNKYKSLGLILDSDLRFRYHVSGLIQHSFSTLKLLYGNKECLDTDLRKKLCDVLVLSRLNYCDKVYGPCLDSVDARRLQRIQNSCLRFIYNIKKYASVSHTLKRANWLNLLARRSYHYACFVHKLILFKTPPYLHRKLVFRTDVHRVNIRFKGTLTPPPHKTALFTRSFTYNACFCYNRVPEHLKKMQLSTFKHKFKEYLLSVG